MSIAHLVPGNRLYEPRGGAKQILYCKDNTILFEGPAGTGKTRAVLEKIHLCAMKYPNCRILICRKTRASMTQSILVTFEEKVLPENSPIKSGPTRENRREYRYSNGSVIIVAGLDNPDRIMSTEYDIICSFESTELTQDDGEKLTTRLRNGVIPYQQWIADCNPGSPTHWLNVDANKGKMTRILSRHADNPSVTPAYLNVLSNLSGARRDRLYLGKWAAQEGLVYDYDPAIHLIDRFPIPSEWRRIRTIDFGYTNPFVCQWWAIDPDGRAYRYREIYMSRRIVSDHAKKIIDASYFINEKGIRMPEKFEATISDHDAEDRATLQRCGIPTIAALKTIATGIQDVQKRLLPEYEGAKPMMLFMRDSLLERDSMMDEQKKPASTEEEFDDYIWPKGSDGKSNKEAPVKMNDHGMDCLKYTAMYLTQPNKVKAAKFYFGDND